MRRTGKNVKINKDGPFQYSVLEHVGDNVSSVVYSDMLVMLCFREDGYEDTELMFDNQLCSPDEANCWHGNGHLQASPGLIKRGGYTDPSATCMSFHCSSRMPGTLGYLRCISLHGCIGRRKR